MVDGTSADIQSPLSNKRRPSDPLLSVLQLAFQVEKASDERAWRYGPGDQNVVAFGLSFRDRNNLQPQE